MARSAMAKKIKKKEDIRKRLNMILDTIFEQAEKGKAFTPEFLKEMEQAGVEARKKRKLKPVKIIKNRVLTKPAITQALNLASDFELAAGGDVKLDMKKWVKEGK